MLFCGIMEGQTDILPIAIFVDIETGDLEGAVSLTIIFIAIVLAILPISRILIRKNKLV